METYWIVKKDDVVVAALCERFYRGAPEELLKDLREMAHTGPLQWIKTANTITIGDSL